jgi:hypothetical protein
VCCTAFKRKNELVRVGSLDRLFEQNNKPNNFTYKNQCTHCGSVVEIKITKTSGGYGFQGGALYETDPQNFFVLCLKCYEELRKPV